MTHSRGQTGERVTVIGAGVIGLTSAILLAESGFLVDVVARDLPTDTESQAFASPWAGANWHSFMRNGKEEDKRQMHWERVTFGRMWSMIGGVPGLIMRLHCLDYYDSPQDHWFKDLVPDYTILDASSLPSNTAAKWGCSFITWSVSAPAYIAYLSSRLRSLGVPITKAALRSLEEPYLRSFTEGLEPARIVVNASSLGARSLIGVEDPNVHPVRGQTVVVWAPHVKDTVMYVDNPAVPPVYIIPRPNGECILGGTFLEDNWDLSPNPSTTQKIISDALAFYPALSHEYSPHAPLLASIDSPISSASLSSAYAPRLTSTPSPESIPVIRVNVGLRPARRGGARLEKEFMSIPFERKPFTPVGLAEGTTSTEKEAKKSQAVVIHAYGIGSGGFQSSWGMAEEVLMLAKEARDELPKQ